MSPKKFSRHWFNGTLERQGDSTAKITIGRGCTRVTVDECGNQLESVRVPAARLWGNIDDQLIIFGAAIDEVASGIVIAVDPRTGDPVVALSYDEILPTTRAITILAGVKGRAKASQDRGQR